MDAEFKTTRRQAGFTAASIKKASGARRLTRKTTVGEAFQHFVATICVTLRRLEANAGAADVETIHHFRTSIRRLRALLSAFEEILPGPERRKLSEHLSDLAQRYGTIREWDVFVATAAAPLAGTVPAPETFADVRRKALIEREAEREEHPRLGGDIAASIDAVAKAGWMRPSRSLGDERIDDRARKILTKQKRRLGRKIKGLDLADQTNLHTCRIMIKKHRYTIEFLSFLYEKKPVRAYLRRLATLQDILGDMRDALVARQLIQQLDISDSSRGLVLGWVAHTVADGMKQAPACGHRVRHTAAFWEK